MSKKVKYLATSETRMISSVLRIATIVVILSTVGCASTPPHIKIGLPERPELVPITQLQWERLDSDMQDVIQHNDLALKAWGKKLEARIELHDEGS